MSIYDKKRHPKDFMLLAFTYFCAVISILLLVGIMFYVFFKGIAMIDFNFLTTVPSSLKIPLVSLVIL